MDATHRRDSAENFDVRNELPANRRQFLEVAGVVVSLVVVVVFVLAAIGAKPNMRDIR
jgi:hypothetical protein